MAWSHTCAPVRSLCNQWSLLHGSQHNDNVKLRQIGTAVQPTAAAAVGGQPGVQQACRASLARRGARSASWPAGSDWPRPRADGHCRGSGDGHGGCDGVCGGGGGGASGGGHGAGAWAARRAAHGLRHHRRARDLQHAGAAGNPGALLLAPRLLLLAPEHAQQAAALLLGLLLSSRCRHGGSTQASKPRELRRPPVALAACQLGCSRAAPATGKMRVIHPCASPSASYGGFSGASSSCQPTIAIMQK